MSAQLLGIAVWLSIVVPICRSLETAQHASVAHSVNFHEAFARAATASDVLPLTQICQEYRLDESACHRVQLYLGSTLANTKQLIHVEHSVLHTGGDYVMPNVVTLSGIQQPASWVSGDLLEAMQDFARVLSRYLSPDLAESRPFVTVFEDYAWREALKIPTFVRPDLTRNRDGNHVLTRMMHYRFDDPVKKVPSEDMPYHTKSDTMVWRGTCSGNDKTTATGSYRNYTRHLMFEAVSRSRDRRIDVGFINNPGCDGHIPPGGEKKEISMKDQLRHKFLLVVEGNDIASGGQWAMASNSVPFMNVPVTQNWALQSLWVPWKHFVPIAPDFSDLSAKLDWAIAHPADAKRIADEGKRFMEEFSDEDREDRIQAAVVTAYFNRLRIKEVDTESWEVGVPLGPDAAPKLLLI